MNIDNIATIENSDLEDLLANLPIDIENEEFASVEILIDEQNNVTHLALIGGYEGGIVIEEPSKEFIANYEAYKYIDGELIYSETQKEQITLFKKQEELRSLRQEQCFSIINRGTLWYTTLSEIQLEELNQWYQDWLKVTETLKIPNKIEWL